jgi:hypothetical protein
MGALFQADSNLSYLMSGLSICGAGGFQPCGRSAMTNTHTHSCYNAKTHIRIYLGRRALILHGGPYALASALRTYVFTHRAECRPQVFEREPSLSLLWCSPVELKLKLLVIRTLGVCAPTRNMAGVCCCWMDLLPWASTRSTLRSF